jgi:hypothetical protein
MGSENRPLDAGFVDDEETLSGLSPFTNGVSTLRTRRPDSRPNGDAAGAAPAPSEAPDAFGPKLPPSCLAGDLQTMVLTDVLLWIYSRKKSGTLHVRHNATRKRVVFQQGVLHSSSSNDPRETLGQFLVRDGLISEEQLFKTLLRQEEQGALLGVLLVSEGLLTADQLKRTLREKAEAIIYDLFLWASGSFFFHEGRLPRSVPINLEMDTQAVVKEGTRRRKRWERIRERFPSSEVTFRVEMPSSIPQDPIDRRIFELAAAGKTLQEISLETRRSEFDTAERLCSLCELNVLSVDRAAAEPAAADTVGAIQELLLLAAQALEERRYDAAFSAFQDVLALDHLNQAAKKGLIAVSEGRKRQRLAKRIQGHLVPVLRISPEALAKEKLTPEESFVIARINGKWDVQALLKLSPLGEEEALVVLGRLLDRKLIDLP